jgi:adenylate cyclase
MDTPALSAMFQFDRFCLRPQGAGLLRQDTTGDWRPVSIGSRTLAVLGVLLERRGTLVSKNEIMRAVWPGTAVEDHNLTVQISTLRRLLDEDSLSESCIQTVTGRGYGFRPAVASQSDGSLLFHSSKHRLAPAPGSRRRLSLAVLPFRNLSDDPGGDYLAETITDELSTDLSTWSYAFVIAGKSAGIPETGPMDVRQLGVELGVSYVIHGSVRGGTERTSVNVQLVDVETGGHLWADRFEADHRAATDARDEIIGRLERGLVRNLLEDVNRRIEALPPRDWSSCDLNMRGRTFMVRPQSLANRRIAIDSFEQALSRDPGSAAARIGIANALIANILDGWGTSIEEDTARAEQLLLKALQGDTDISQAHACMGKLRRIQGRLSDSRVELEIALGMSPNSSDAMKQLGFTLAFLGLPETAIPRLEKSLRLAPHDHGKPGNQAALGLCYLMLGEVESGIIWLRKARAGNPQMYYVHMWLAAGLGFHGELVEGGAALRRSIEIKPDIDSLAALRARWQMMTTSPRFFMLVEKTVIPGLRRAGLPDISEGGPIEEFARPR